MENSQVKFLDDSARMPLNQNKQDSPFKIGDISEIQLTDLT